MQAGRDTSGKDEPRKSLCERRPAGGLAIVQRLHRKNRNAGSSQSRYDLVDVKRFRRNLLKVLAVLLVVLGLNLAYSLVNRLPPDHRDAFRTFTVLVAFPLYFWIAYRIEQRPLKRWRRGQCISCGYDLRATRDRCPECGRPIVLTRRRQAGPLRRLQ